MKFELFGIDRFGKFEFLGFFGQQDQVLRALDEYAGMGYKNLSFCSWKKR